MTANVDIKAGFESSLSGGTRAFLVSGKPSSGFRFFTSSAAGKKRLGSVEDLTVINGNRNSPSHQIAKFGSPSDPFTVLSAHFLGLAKVYLKQQLYFEAGGESLAALELVYHNPRAHFVYASVVIKLGQLKIAEQSLLTAIAQNPKIVAPLLASLSPELPAKVIFMQRPASEVIASQRSMLERDGKQGAATDDASLARVYAAQLEGIERLLGARPKCELLAVDFAQAVEQPTQVAEQVCAFLGLDADEAPKMAAVAEKTLYRARAVAP
jgi:hypothetical protein